MVMLFQRRIRVTAWSRQAAFQTDYPSGSKPILSWQHPFLIEKPNLHRCPSGTSKSANGSRARQALRTLKDRTVHCEKKAANCQITSCHSLSPHCWRRGCLVKATRWRVARGLDKAPPAPRRSAEKRESQHVMSLLLSHDPHNRKNMGRALST